MTRSQAAESPLLLFALLAGSSLTVMSAAALSPGMPALTEAFRHAPMADLLTRLVLTMPALFIALCAPFGGWLVDRVGRQPVIIVSLVLYGLSGSVGLFTDSLVVLLASRALLGMAVGGLMTACTTLIGDCFRGARRSQVLGLQASSAAVGGVLFLFGGGLLAELHWRGPFVLYTASIVLLPVMLMALRHVPPADRDDGTTAHGEPVQRPPPRLALAGLYASMLVGMGLFFITPVQLPYRMVELGYMSGAQAGAALSVNTICAAIVSFRYRQLQALMSDRYLLVTAYVSLAVGLGLIGFAESLLPLLLGLALAGSALGLLIPTVNQWLLRIAPVERRGRVMSGSTAGLFLGQFLSPLLSQPAVSLLGLAGGFLLFSLLATLVAAVLWLGIFLGRGSENTSTS